MSKLTGRIAIDATLDTPIFCSCPACMMGRGDNQKGLPQDGMEQARASDDGPATDSANPGIFELLDIHQALDGTYYFSGDRDVDAALIGSRWTVTNITYSFPTSGDAYGEGYDTGQADKQLAFNTQQQDVARGAFDLLASYCGLTFTEVDESTQGPAIIRLSQTGSAGTGSASGYFPGPDYRSGDIWFGRTNQPFYDTPEKGNWGFATIMHEIGHTMGLKHGHQDYTLQDLQSFFGNGGPRPGSQSTPFDHDGQAWTIMSYRSNPGAVQDFAGDEFNQPQSYMQNDIAALQYLYGANFTTNGTDTTYTWSETTGEMFVNGVGQGAANSNTIFLTLWDGGGHDTFDLQNYDGGVRVDLRPGGFSTFSADQLANNRAYQDDVAYAPGNVGMALLFEGNTASLIEDVVSGDGADVIIGNQAQNSLTGGMGDDLLDGQAGNDTMDGGSGSDTADFGFTTGGVSVTLNDGAGDIAVANGGDTDTLRSIENVIGGSGDDTLVGDSAANLLGSGALGDDNLSGNGGDDILIGSGYILNPVDRPDITKLGTLPNNSTANAVVVSSLSDFDLVSDPTIINSTTVPHATVNATAFGGVFEYYRFDAVAGDVGVFDIDTLGTSNLDSWIHLLNSGGTSIANNDTGFSVDNGGNANDDALITFSFTSTGTYYIQVGQFLTATPASAQALTAGQTYTLNFSLQSATATFNAPTTGSSDMDGGEGDDLIFASNGDDTIDGDDDSDTLSYGNAVNGVTFSLALQGTVQNTGAGMDAVVGIENLIGSSHNDTLTGDGDGNLINGGSGDDVMDGGGGNDTLSYEDAVAGVTFSLSIAGAQATGGSGSDSATGFEDIVGSAFNDSLGGDSSFNIVSGGDGDDVLNGRGFAIAIDTLIGGNGIDIASFNDAAYAGGVVATLNNGADVFATDFGAVQQALLQGIEGLEGGNGNDALNGDNLANVLRGGGGGDTMNGGTGNDTMEGGLGDDSLNGSADIDTLVFTGATAITVNLGTITAQATGYGSDTIFGFENVVTGSGNDNITGDGNDNVFYDNGGNDTYAGGGGSDTLDYSSRTAAVSVALQTATGQNTGGGGTDTITGFENVTGTAFNDTFNGQGGTGTIATSNRFIGGAGHDQIQGNTGGDYLEGGDGSDLLAGDLINAVSTTDGATSADGADTIVGGQGADVIITGLGNDSVDAGTGNDTIVQGLGNGTRSSTGSTLTAIFANFGGFDTVMGGEGFDTCYLFYGGQAGDLVVNISVPEQNNFITLGGGAAGLLNSVERILARGGLGNDSMTGGESGDSLVGNEGNDVLDGGIGNDSLVGNLGDDQFIGGDGLDVVSYAGSATGVTVDLAAGTGTGEGSDTFSGVEYLIASAFTDHLMGDDAFNSIIDTGVAGGVGGSDWYEGRGGSDILTMTRGAGHTSSSLILDGGSGADALSLTSATRTVSAVAQMDNATLLGGDGIDTITATGTGIASTQIDGGNGNDLITVGLTAAASFGTHTITGGAGSDQFILSGNSAAAGTTARSGVITDFQAKGGGDRFEWSTFLNGLALSGYTANSDAFAGGFLRLMQNGLDLLLQIDRDGSVGGGGFVNLFTITGGVAKGFTAFNLDGMIANGMALNGTAGPDTVKGGDGNDSIATGLHTDLIEGGAGNDLMDGGDQNDTATYEYATGAVIVDLVDAGPQNTGGWGMDTLLNIEHLIGSAYADTLAGTSGYNRLEGGLGTDNISGREGDDRLFGGDGNDTLSGGLADDRIDGGDGQDTVTYLSLAGALNIDIGGGTASGDGNDTLIRIEHAVGGDGNDTISGSGHANMLSGAGGDDVVSGLQGADNLQGWAGLDTLNGGRGADDLTGGADADTFVFDDLDGQTDHVTDLEASDIIDLSLIDANMNKPGNPGFDLVTSFTGHRAEATLTYDSGSDTTTLDMDRNGDGTSDLAITMAGDHTGHTNFLGLTI